MWHYESKPDPWFRTDDNKLVHLSRVDLIEIVEVAGEYRVTVTMSSGVAVLTRESSYEEAVETIFNIQKALAGG